MSLFVITMGFGDSILAGSLTLGLLTLPVVIRTTEEALLSVDSSFRIGSYALGASKLYTIRKVVLPIAFPILLPENPFNRAWFRRNGSDSFYQ
jgi:phosphate transport system permease protein